AAQLVRAGLVSRQVDLADARASLFLITEQGRAVCDTLKQHRSDAIHAALSSWSDQELSAFTAMFRRFNHAVEQQHAGQEPITVPTAARTSAAPSQEKM